MQRQIVVTAMLLSFVGAAQATNAQADSIEIISPTNAQVLSSMESRLTKIDQRLIASSAFETPTSPAINSNRPLRLPQETESHRLRNATIGGVLGAALGIVVCTGISNIMDDSAKARVSTCDATGNLMFGVTGAGVGALIGAAIK